VDRYTPAAYHAPATKPERVAIGEAALLEPQQTCAARSWSGLLAFLWISSYRQNRPS